MKNRLIALLLAVCGVILFAACGISTETPAKVEPSESDGQEPWESPEAPPEEIRRDYSVGDTIKVGDLEITVCGVYTSEGESFFTPEDGNVFYLMNVVVANKGDQPETLSSMLMFDLRDSDGFSVDQSFSAQSIGASGLDGTVLPGKVIRGDIGYEVPADPTGYQLQINPDIIGSSGLFSVALDEIPDNIDALEAPQSTKTGAEIQIAQTYSTGTLDFTVNGISTSSGKDFFTPDDGNEFLLVDVSVTNTGSETESVSSMMMFELRDGRGFSYNLSISASSVGKGNLDGEVMAGKTLRGELGYEVPTDMKGLELFVNPNVFGSDVFVVTLN